jgi:hypothetical protein
MRLASRPSFTIFCAFLASRLIIERFKEYEVFGIYIKYISKKFLKNLSAKGYIEGNIMATVLDIDEF